MIYHRLTTAQSSEVHASYLALIQTSRQRRADFLLRRDLDQALRAMHWGPGAANELAAIQLSPRSAA